MTQIEHYIWSAYTQPGVSLSEAVGQALIRAVRESDAEGATTPSDAPLALQPPPHASDDDPSAQDVPPATAQQSAHTSSIPTHITDQYALGRTPEEFAEIVRAVEAHLPKYQGYPRDVVPYPALFRQEMARDELRKAKDQGRIPDRLIRSDSLIPHAAVPDAMSPDALADHEKKALRKYGQQNGGWRKLNKGLREGKPLDGNAQRLHEALTSAFQNMDVSDQPIVSWRGLNLTGPKAKQLMDSFDESLQNKAPVRLQGYISTSTSPKTATGFEGGAAPIVLEIMSRKAINVAPVATYSTEREILLEHNASFTVHGIQEVMFSDSSGKLTKKQVVQLEQVVDGKPSNARVSEGRATRGVPTNVPTRFVAFDDSEFVFANRPVREARRHSSRMGVVQLVCALLEACEKCYGKIRH